MPTAPDSTDSLPADRPVWAGNWASPIPWAPSIQFGPERDHAAGPPPIGLTIGRPRGQVGTTGHKPGDRLALPHRGTPRARGNRWPDSPGGQGGGSVAGGVWLA